MRHDLFWNNFKLSCDWSCVHVTFLVVVWPFMWACDHINIENNYLVSSSWLFWYAIWHIFDQFQFIMWPVIWSCGHVTFLVVMWPFMWACDHINIENNYPVSSSRLFWYAIWQIFDQFQFIMWPVMWSCDWSCGHIPCHMYLWQYNHLNFMIK